jgi:hypothetical protein
MAALGCPPTLVGGHQQAARTCGVCTMKRRLLCTILIVDGALVLAVAGLHIADHLSGVPCAPIHYSYYDCSVYL